MLKAETAIRDYVGEAFRMVTGRVTLPEINVTFYGFAGLNHTIRIRRQKIYVRISDLLLTAPPPVWRALAGILVARLFGHRPAAEDLRIYRQYTCQPEVVRASDLARRQRGRKMLAPEGPRGVYDLDRIFARLNRRYFQNSLPKPQLSWSVRRTMRVLGHHDDVHETIVISRALNDVEVPEYLVEYVLYHEMLHLKHPARMVDGRRIYHSPAFRRDERRFDRYAEALAALEEIK